MKSTIFGVVLICLASLGVQAATGQKAIEGPAKIKSVFENRSNTVTLELLGRAGLYSFNYDKLVTEEVAVGAGLAHYDNVVGLFDLTVIPIYANYYFLKGSHRPYLTGALDIPIFSGIKIASEYEHLVIAPTVYPVFGGGYEYRGAFVFRIAPYLLVDFVSGNSAFWAGMSLGAGF